MGKDLELRSANADLEPLMGPWPNSAVNSTYSGNNDIPAWLEAEPPYGPTDGVIDTTARVWSLIIRWPRRAALGFLWITYTPWRFLALAGTVLLIIFALTSKSA